MNHFYISFHWKLIFGRLLAVFLSSLHSLTVSNQTRKTGKSTTKSIQYFFKSNINSEFKHKFVQFWFIYLEISETLSIRECPKYLHLIFLRTFAKFAHACKLDACVGLTSAKAQQIWQNLWKVEKSMKIQGNK